MKTSSHRGENHHRARHTEAQVARAKALLAAAPRTQVARGVVPAIAEATGLTAHTLHNIIHKGGWSHVAPADPAEVEGLINWTELAPNWDPLPPQGQPLPAADVPASTPSSVDAGEVTA